MAFDVDAFLTECDFSPFPITYKGRTFDLPHFDTLTADQAVIFERGDIREGLTALCGEDAAVLLMGMPIRALNALMEAWQKQGDGAATGESAASSSS